MSRPEAYGELADTAVSRGSHGLSPSMTRTPSSSSATSTCTCIPSVPAPRPVSPNSCTIRS